MLIHHIFVIMLYFIYFYFYLFSRIGHDLGHEQCCLNKDRSFVMPTSSIRLCSILCFKVSEWCSICWQIASRSYMPLYMAFSRKYGTVWYHPTSSKLWHLTVLPFVNFRKIDWHTLESARVWSQLVRLAVCLAQGADFASTLFSQNIWRKNGLSCSGEYVVIEMSRLVFLGPSEISLMGFF
jgi:hypothetical protein